MLEKLISELSDILECDKHAISADTHFKELEQWDSLAHVSTVSMIDDVFDTVLSEDEIKRVSTVADLASLVESKI
jgi:acyl carrier protein